MQKPYIAMLALCALSACSDPVLTDNGALTNYFKGSAYAKFFNQHSMSISLSCERQRGEKLPLRIVMGIHDQFGTKTLETGDACEGEGLRLTIELDSWNRTFAVESNKDYSEALLARYAQKAIDAEKPRESL